jgi:hypothetical protein
MRNFWWHAQVWGGQQLGIALDFIFAFIFYI